MGRDTAEAGGCTEHSNIPWFPSKCHQWKWWYPMLSPTGMEQGGDGASNREQPMQTLRGAAQGAWGP